MFVAQKLKKENIIEYLLYMWQVEDLLRAFGLDMDTVNERIVRYYPAASETDRKALYVWYESIIEMLKAENAAASGHIQLNKNAVLQLADFHEQLLQSGITPDYNAKFFHILPSINALHKKSASSVSDIEAVLNFMYGIMVLQMRKTEISPDTLKTKDEMAKFLQLLAKYYKMYQKGELDLEN